MYRKLVLYVKNDSHLKLLYNQFGSGNEI